VAWAVLGSNAVVIMQWFLFGHSLAFSTSATNGYMGNMAHTALRNVMGNPSATTPLLPDMLLSFFQMEIACVTVGIWIGAVADRGRMLPAMVFTFLWMTVVYCPLVYWIWNPRGWAWRYGALDFAGKIYITECLC
jgi:Amt family ammonium transporter